MTLGDWLRQNALSPAEFARRIGRPQATIQRYVAGKRIPEPAIMNLIVDATGGAVTPNDFYAVTTSSNEAAE